MISACIPSSMKIVISTAVIRNITMTGISINGAESAGGIVGENLGMIQSCSVSGSMTATGTNAGGIAGNNLGGTVRACHTSVTITGFWNVGGISGASRGTVDNCYSTGNITSTGQNVGGIVGYNFSEGSSGKISNCYSVGSIKGSGYTGGIAGSNTTGCTITNCAALNPSVKEEFWVCRITGGNGGTLTNNYAYAGLLNNSNNTTWNYKGATDRDGADVTGALAKTQSTYTGMGWSFGSTVTAPWKFISGYPPVLYWQTAYPVTLTHLN